MLDTGGAAGELQSTVGGEGSRGRSHGDAGSEAARRSATRQVQNANGKPGKLETGLYPPRAGSAAHRGSAWRIHETRNARPLSIRRTVIRRHIALHARNVSAHGFALSCRRAGALAGMAPHGLDRGPQE
ncbi:hypothetical protein PSAC2689_90090 [Paraburkholderia sacchari]